MGTRVKRHQTSVPSTDRAGFAVYLETQLHDKGTTSQRLAAESTLARETIQQFISGHSSQTNIALWTIVGLADALGVRVDEVIEAVSPGFSINVLSRDVDAARETVRLRARRLRTPEKSAAVVVPIAAERPSSLPSRVQVVVPTVPTALELMQLVRSLGDEERLLVAEFIKEVAA